MVTDTYLSLFFPTFCNILMAIQYSISVNFSVMCLLSFMFITEVVVCGGAFIWLLV